VARAATIAAVLLALLPGCRSGEEARGPRVDAVAVVNGEPVPRASLERELQQLRVGGAEGADVTLLRQSALDGLVTRVLLLQQARARGIAAPPDRVERALLALRAEYPGTAFDDLLAQERLSVAELKGRLRDQLTVERLFQEEAFPQVQVSDAEVDSWYADHAGEMDEPERVHALQIVVRTREEAIRVREEVRRKPQAFADVARRASIGPEGKTGGDLGWFGRGQGMPEVFDACFRLAPGAVSDVIPSPYGFHVFKAVEKRPASHRSLAEARTAIHQRLLREKRARAQEDYVAALRARASIEIDKAAVAAVNP
jgi:peptidyl-prolyl cis-trans isomerase C